MRPTHRAHSKNDPMGLAAVALGSNLHLLYTECSLAPDLAPPFLIQLPANAPGQALQHDPSAGAHTPRWQRKHLASAWSSPD